MLWIIILYWFIIISGSIGRHQLNLYFADWRRYELNLMHDCLYYNAENHLPEYDNGYWEKLSQIIPYCIRENLDETLDVVSSDMNGTSLTFDELRRKEITSEQLYVWSAPIDTVELYQLYLDNSDETLSNETFNNCSRSWFGQFCEYRFDDDLSLDDMIKISFFSKSVHSDYVLEVTNNTCYIHLDCYNNSELFCLDWRDVCDGKVDCFNGNADERDCFQLEMNICNEDEFQCHNGQCIPMEYFSNNPANPDCLDGTDESSRLMCHEDPTMRCEDRSGSHHYQQPKRVFYFNCGDGESISLGFEGFDCRNQRYSQFHQILFSKSNNPTLTVECWLVMIHYFQLHDYVNILIDENFPCYRIDNSCIEFILYNCPSLFVFPASPALFGHIYLYYSRNESFMYSTSAKPKYVCFNNQLCPFLSWTIQINGSTCRLFDELSKKSGWFDIIGELANIFWACSTNGITEEDCRKKNFFQCENSKKCISNERLVDGFIDCLDGSDERTNYSCSLNDHLRFACTSENKCISHLLYQNLKKDCLNGEDEQYENGFIVEEYVSFPDICDGFIDFKREIYVKNNSVETDETNCDQWLCNNIYTRCDGFWNCKNGIDELNCSNTSDICSENEFQCVSSKTFELGCLSASQADDGHIDCLGGSDERFYCRNQIPLVPERRYHCLNSTKCIDTYSLCRSLSLCTHEDHNRFCEKIDSIMGICDEYIADPKLERHPSLKFLCELDESPKDMITKDFRLTEQKYRSVLAIALDSSENTDETLSEIDYLTGSLNVAWFCNRGLFVWRRTENNEYTGYCFCPPAYYGYRCEFQNQRISLSYRVYTVEWRIAFHLVIMLIDNTSQIHSYEQRNYLAMRDCDIQFGLNLLYSNRPKDHSKNYIVRIDLFEHSKLKYRASWQFPIQFSFLPVYRIATALRIPSQLSTSSKLCSPGCIHGECFLYTNTQRPFCRCFQRWSGLSCEKSYDCNCTNGSVCIGLDNNNNTICACPLDKYGARCRLTRSSCAPNPCLNSGLCVPVDERIDKHKFACICKKGFTGMRCEREESKIEISFSNMDIPSLVLAHFITVRNNTSHLHTNMMKKPPLDQNSVTFYQSLEYHLIFTQFSGYYYLSYVEPKFKSATKLSLSLFPVDKCLSTTLLLNSTIRKLSLLGRTKYYYVLCREQIHLKCFYDEIHMCLCSNERHANCLDFDHNKTYDCYGFNDCENGAQCLQDDPTCPSTRSCVCNDCFYGARCQFSTKDFQLSLETILGYQIRPHIVLLQQTMAVKISIAVTMIIFVLGLINGIVSIITFQSVQVRTVGCGLYLLVSSIMSLLTTIIFSLKFWHVLLVQKGAITNRIYLEGSCYIFDVLLQVFINSIEWLNAVVIVERAFATMKGVHFNKEKTKRVAKIVIPVLISFISLTYIHDPLHRHVIDDTEEERTWCIALYSDKIKLFDSIIKMFHFLAPFLLNFCSAAIIIITISRNRSVIKKQTTFIKHLHEQFREHRHLLISPILLIILNLPRIIIGFTSGCMKSARNPWIFLIGYFISFISSFLTFIIFVVPSQTYRKEFDGAIRRLLRLRSS